jgi:hypothetical protein
MEEQRTRQPYLRQIARPSEMRENVIIGPVNKIPQPIPPISESCSTRTRRCYLIQTEGRLATKEEGLRAGRPRRGSIGRRPGSCGGPAELQAEEHDGVKLGLQTNHGGTNNSAGGGSGEAARPLGQLGRFLAEP